MQYPYQRQMNPYLASPKPNNQRFKQPIFMQRPNQPIYANPPHMYQKPAQIFYNQQPPQSKIVQINKILENSSANYFEDKIEKLVAINKKYEILCSEKAKQVYDLELRLNKIEEANSPNKENKQTKSLKTKVKLLALEKEKLQKQLSTSQRLENVPLITKTQVQNLEIQELKAKLRKKDEDNLALSTQLQQKSEYSMKVEKQLTEANIKNLSNTKEQQSNQIEENQFKKTIIQQQKEIYNFQKLVKKLEDSNNSDKKQKDDISVKSKFQSLKKLAKVPTPLKVNLVEVKKIQDLEKDILSLKESIKDLETKNKKLEIKEANFIKLHKQQMDENEELVVQISQAQTDLVQRESVIQDVQFIAETGQMKITTLTKEKEVLKQGCSELETKLSRKEVDLKQLQVMKEENDGKMNMESQAKLTEMEREILLLYQEKDTWESEKQDFLRKLDEEQNQYDEILQNHEKLEKDNLKKDNELQLCKEKFQQYDLKCAQLLDEHQDMVIKYDKIIINNLLLKTEVKRLHQVQASLVLSLETGLKEENWQDQHSQLEQQYEELIMELTKQEEYNKQLQKEIAQQKSGMSQDVSELLAQQKKDKETVQGLEKLNEEFITNMHLEKKAKDSAKKYYMDQNDRNMVSILLLGSEVERLHNIIEMECQRETSYITSTHDEAFQGQMQQQQQQQQQFTNNQVNY